MPKVHCISRKWLEQRKMMQACTNQAERMRREAAAADKNHPLPSKDADSRHDSPDNRLSRYTSDGRRHNAAPAKKRWLRKKAADNIIPTITPQSAPNNDDSVISDTPSRKRKMRSCQQQSSEAKDRLVDISKAISDRIMPHYNDFICPGQGRVYANHNHPGNQKVHEWASNLKDEYNLARKKNTKAAHIVNQVLGLLRELDPPGRVLVKHRFLEDEYWLELVGSQAIEKIRYYCFNSTTTQDSHTLQSRIVSEEDVSGEEVVISERDEVTNILNSMVTVVDALVDDEAYKAPVDDKQWKIEEKKVQKFTQEAFKQSNITNDFACWKALVEHSNQINAPLAFSYQTFRDWWNDIDSRTQMLPQGSINVFTSYCRQQHMISYYRQDVAVLVPSGKLGIVLETCVNGKAVIGKVRMSSFLVNQVCPGDRIIAIDEEDVSGMSLSEISAIMTRKNDLDKVLVIKPSLISTMPFTNNPSPPSSYSKLSILCVTYIKTYISTNRLRYNEVRVLLQLPLPLLCDEVGGKLCELYAEYGSHFHEAFSEAKKAVAHWYVFVVDSKRQQSFDIVFTSTKVSAPIVSGSTATCEGKFQEICDCVKTYIATNRMQYNDIRNLLRLSPSAVLERVGGKLFELHEEMGTDGFETVISQAKKHILYMFMSNPNFDASHTLAAIVDGKAVHVRVTQDLSTECKAIYNHNGSQNEDECKIAKLVEKAALELNCVSAQKDSCLALRKYIVNEDSTSLTLRLGGLNMLANAMKAHSDCGNIQAEALLTLCQVVWSYPSASVPIVDQGCLHLAINAKAKHVGHTKTQQAACDFFVALSYNLDCCRAMLKSKVISSVLRSIRRNSSKVNLLVSAYRYCQNMAAVALDTVAKAILDEEDILPTLLKTIRKNPSRTHLLISACGLLSNIALHPDGSTCIVEAGGTEILQKVLLSSYKNSHLAQNALSALRNLAQNAAVAERLAENGFASKLIDITRAFRFNPDILLISLGFLSNLIDSEVAVSSGVESIALAAIENHPDENDLRSVAFAILQKVAE